MSPAIKAHTATIEERSEVVEMLYAEFAARRWDKNSAASVAASLLLNILLECRTLEAAGKTLDVIKEEIWKSLVQSWLLDHAEPGGPNAVN